MMRPAIKFSEWKAERIAVMANNPEAIRRLEEGPDALRLRQRTESKKALIAAMVEHANCPDCTQPLTFVRR